MNMRHEEQIKHQIKHVVVFSLDFDGCADILFPDFNEIHPKEADYENVIREMGDIFLNYLQDIISDVQFWYSKDEVAVVLYVGSARQDHYCDQLGHNQNKKGLCFPNYEQLCQSQGWVFNQLLYADVSNHLLPGTAMADKTIRMLQVFDKNKVEIIDAQLDNIKLHYPNVPIDFHFIDDDAHDCQILDSLGRHFSKNRLHGIHLHLHKHTRSTVKSIVDILRCEEEIDDLMVYCYHKEIYSIPAREFKYSPSDIVPLDSDGSIFDTVIFKPIFFQPAASGDNEVEHQLSLRKL